MSAFCLDVGRSYSSLDQFRPSFWSDSGWSLIHYTSASTVICHTCNVFFPISFQKSYTFQYVNDYRLLSNALVRHFISKQNPKHVSFHSVLLLARLWMPSLVLIIRIVFDLEDTWIKHFSVFCLAPFLSSAKQRWLRLEYFPFMLKMDSRVEWLPAR